MDEQELQKLIEKQGKEQRATIEKLMKDLKKQGLSESEIKRVNQSLKDLGKKWFAFSRIDSLLPEIKKRL